ncbi:carbohydrate ABC transporter permease [Cohnella nanjingensis]|uniref:Sugar ABC transporter permease n=1 Tax=Cohnella nanjingensis TaxID=1387779 RepID=A0A7X0VEA6_9BACL|nr:sugar ABC transporter permease [Cohnella nanjingensis]MBB6670810.1 sugar ABC transporter permease [Cohnella nanjingensis]
MHIFAKWWIKQLLVVPTLILFLIYTLYPIIDSLMLAFSHKPPFKKPYFVGLDNFYGLFNDPVFIIALRNTTIVVIGSVLLIPLGLLLGLLLNVSFRGATAVKVISFAPNIVSPFLTGLVFFFIVDPGVGVLNGFLDKIGLHALAFKWIGGERLTPYTVTVLDSWKGLGGLGVFFYAALKMMPKDMFEAATIDGATSMQKFWKITIPMLKETFKFITVLTIIGGLGSYQTFYILTSGGPHHKSETLGSYMFYIMQSKGGDIGKTSAMALVMFILSMSAAILYLHLTRKRLDE